MSAMIAPSRDADISDYTTNSPPWDKDAEAVRPDLLQFPLEVFVLCDGTKL